MATRVSRNIIQEAIELLESLKAIIEKGLTTMPPERMKHGADRRAWVKAADEKLPGMRVKAINLQNIAAQAFEDWNSLSVSDQKKYSFMQWIISESYEEARRELYQVLLYEGMRRLNLD
jgi:hypothetical protein